VGNGAPPFVATVILSPPASVTTSLARSLYRGVVEFKVKCKIESMVEA
jgi:hypothetical protein